MGEKDGWDKANIIAKIISSVVLAMVSIVITVVIHSKELENKNYILIKNSVDMLNSDNEMQQNAALNLIMNKMDRDEGLNLLYGSIDETNIDNLCNTIKDREEGIGEIENIAESLYIDEAYNVAQIEYQLRGESSTEKVYANGLFDAGQNFIHTIDKNLVGRILNIFVFDSYGNETTDIPIDHLGNYRFDMERSYDEQVRIYSGPINKNDIMFCLYIDRNHLPHIKVFRVVSCSNEMIRAKILGDDEAIPTGGVLFNSKREYVGLKHGFIESEKIYRFSRLVNKD